MSKEYYIGIMSGTSLDGVDVVLCKIDASECTLVSSLEYPLPLELKSDILTMIEYLRRSRADRLSFGFVIYPSGRSITHP